MLQYDHYIELLGKFYTQHLVMILILTEMDPGGGGGGTGVPTEMCPQTDCSNLSFSIR